MTVPYKMRVTALATAQGQKRSSKAVARVHSVPLIEHYPRKAQHHVLVGLVGDQSAMYQRMLSDRADVDGDQMILAHLEIGIGNKRRPGRFKLDEMADFSGINLNTIDPALRKLISDFLESQPRRFMLPDEADYYTRGWLTRHLAIHPWIATAIPEIPELSHVRILVHDAQTPAGLSRLGTILEGAQVVDGYCTSNTEVQLQFPKWLEFPVSIPHLGVTA